MIRIVITEDQDDDRKKLAGYIRRYARDNGEMVEILEYADGLDLLENYPQSPDILFLDIDMVHSNGMETAHRIRSFDEHVKILFVTRMVQYALEGYEVQAVDYIIKPVTYELFSGKFSRVIREIAREESAAVNIRTVDGQILIVPDELIRAETTGRHLMLVVRRNQSREREIRETTMPMYQLEKILEPYDFFRCHSAFLINLKYVTGYSQTDVIMDDEKIPLSKHRRKAFVDALLAFHASRP
ncbi:MAG: response regulator transcription factor [Lachnospiraceae bacterium]|nr:response regulator transcription factor [Lachnospiraceae bacterium]